MWFLKKSEFFEKRNLIFYLKSVGESDDKIEEGKRYF